MIIVSVLNEAIPCSEDDDGATSSSILLVVNDNFLRFAARGDGSSLLSSAITLTVNIDKNKSRI